MTLNDSFPINLRKKLSEACMTQKDLAKESGITECAISSYLNGSRTPNVKATIAMARVLGTTCEELFSDTCGSHNEKISFDNLKREVRKIKPLLSVDKKQELIKEILK